MNICLDKIRFILLALFVISGLNDLSAQSADTLKTKLNKKQQTAMDAKKAELRYKKYIKERYAHIDSYALAAPKELEITTKLLSSYLSLAPPCVSREEKLRSIYTWTINNIKFDWYLWAYENKMGLKSIPDSSRNIIKWQLYKLRMNKKKYKKATTNASILEAGKATDKGLAQLFNTLCYEAGLKSIEITGYKKDDLWQKGDMIYRTNHKWNAIYLGKKWYFVDVSNHLWILDQKAMKKKMIPAEPMWQMTKKPISMNGFIMEKEQYFSEKYSYIDTIKSIRKMNPQKKKIARAKTINRFNNDHFNDIAYAYLEVSKEMFLLAKSPKTGMKKAQNGFNLAAKNFKIAAGYLKGIKKNELKPVSKRTINRNKAFNKEKAGEFKALSKELEALKKKGPPESTLEDDMAALNEKYADALINLDAQLIDKIKEAGDHDAMKSLIKRRYARIIDSTNKAQKTEIKVLKEADNSRAKLFQGKLKAKKDSIGEAGDLEDQRFNRIKKMTKKKLKNDLKTNSKDTFYAKSMAKKSKKEAKKMKSAIKKRLKDQKEEAKKQAGKDKEAAKKAAAKQKELDAKIKAKQKEDGK